MLSQTKNGYDSDLESTELYLSPNYPNPFREKTTIKYCVAYETRVQITVYNHDGDVIEKLVDEVKQPGTYVTEFSAVRTHSGEVRNLSPGYYCYYMIAGAFVSDKIWLCINNFSGKINMKSLLQFLW